MITFDAKQDRINRSGLLRKLIPPVIGVMVLIAVLSWMDKRDREVLIEADKEFKKIYMEALQVNFRSASTAGNK